MARALPVRSQYVPERAGCEPLRREETRGTGRVPAAEEGRDMPDDVIARTAQGRLRGTRDGQALRFLGIPYAQPPVTAGRFAAPVPHGRWDGTRDALAYGAT